MLEKENKNTTGLRGRLEPPKKPLRTSPTVGQSSSLPRALSSSISLTHTQAFGHATSTDSVLSPPPLAVMYDRATCPSPSSLVVPLAPRSKTHKWTRSCCDFLNPSKMFHPCKTSWETVACIAVSCTNVSCSLELGVVLRALERSSSLSLLRKFIAFKSCEKTTAAGHTTKGV